MLSIDVIGQGFARSMGPNGNMGINGPTFPWFLFFFIYEVDVAYVESSTLLYLKIAERDGYDMYNNVFCVNYEPYFFHSEPEPFQNNGWKNHSLAFYSFMLIY